MTPPPSPTTVVGREGEECLPPHPPPGDEPPSDGGLQIRGTGARIEGDPAVPVATASSGGEHRTTPPGPRSQPNGLIPRALARSCPGRRPPWTPERERSLSTAGVARRRRREARSRQTADAKDRAYPTCCTGGQSPLSMSLWPARPPEEGERGAGGAPGATERHVGALLYSVWIANKK
jgi:hypothetical protein